MEDMEYSNTRTCIWGDGYFLPLQVDYFGGVFTVSQKYLGINKYEYTKHLFCKGADGNPMEYKSHPISAEAYYNLLRECEEATLESLY